MEIQDTYVRLDRSIADLLEVLDKKVGLQNVLIFVTSTGYIRVIDIDLNAPLIVAKAVLPAMMEKRAGKIINICSMTVSYTHLDVYKRQGIDSISYFQSGCVVTVFSCLLIK